MAVFRKKFPTLFAIYVALYISAVDGIRTQQWAHNFGNSVFSHDGSFLTNPGQVYGNCNPQLVDMKKDKFETTCKFAMEMADASIDSPDHVRKCDVTLTKDIPHNNTMYMLEEVVAIAKDRAVMRFEGHSSQVIFVLNFADCTVANSYADKSFMSVHAPSKNKFDVISLKTNEIGQKFRTTFDADGKVVSSEKPWFKGDSKFVAAADSPTKGRLVIEIIKYFIDSSLEPAVRISAIADDGSSKTLKEYSIDDRGMFVPRERFVHSTTYNLVSLCARANKTAPMKCSQLDLDGNVKFETEISLEEYSPAHSFRLHNLPHGGFLLVIFKCDPEPKPTCFLREESFYVKKIDAAGKSVGALKVNDNYNPTDVSMGAMHVFESDKNEICLSNVRSRSNDWDLVLDVVCLEDKDFSGEITWPHY